MSYVRTRKARLFRKPDRIVFGLMMAFVVVAITTGVLAFVFIRNLVLSWSLTSLPGAPVVQTSKGNNNNNNGGSGPIVVPTGPEYQQPLQESDQGPAPKAWDGVSRVNILLMGLDYRDWVAGDIPRTDTMILFTIDPLSKTAGMLSIPRDMWVSIPGYDYGKINTAYFLGEANKLPGGGPALAAKTVENFLGVPVQYYAQIDFGAFVKFIDEIGGIRLTVKEPLKIYPIINGASQTVVLQPGRYRINGDLALAYARDRHTDLGDFDRAERQQQVILAIREQILSFNMLPTLITKSPQIYKDLSSGIHTNLNLQQVIQLALLASQIDKSNIHQAVLGPNTVYNGTSPDGLQAILIPIPDEIRIVRDEIFTTSGPVGPAAVSQDTMELVKQEQARISVQNGSTTNGLASRTSDYFKSQGLNVVEQTNADKLYENTVIYIYSGTPYTLKYLSDLMKVDVSRIYNSYDPNSKINIKVILGKDWANQNPMK